MVSAGENFAPRAPVGFGKGVWPAAVMGG